MGFVKEIEKKPSIFAFYSFEKKKKERRKDEKEN